MIFSHLHNLPHRNIKVLPLQASSPKLFSPVNLAGLFSCPVSLRIEPTVPRDSNAAAFAENSQTIQLIACVPRAP